MLLTDRTLSNDVAGTLSQFAEPFRLDALRLIRNYMVTYASR
jgi:hypothetical protein